MMPVGYFSLSRQNIVQTFAHYFGGGGGELFDGYIWLYLDVGHFLSQVQYKSVVVSIVCIGI